MAYIPLPVRTSADVNASADVNRLQENIDATIRYMRPRRNYIIDGDFNFWNRGITTRSTDGYLSDVWRANGSGTWSVSRIASDTPSKSFGIELITNGFVYIQNKISGTVFANKKISVIIKARYVGSPTDMFVIVYDHLGNDLFVDTIEPTSSYQYYRVDMDIGSYTGDYTELFISNNGSTTVQIQSVRAFETHDTPAGIIPDAWKEDEDREAVGSVVKQYFEALIGQVGFNWVRPAFVFSSTGIISIIEYTKKIRIPNVSFSGTLNTNISGVSAIPSSIGFNDRNDDRFALFCNMGSSYTLGDAGGVWIPNGSRFLIDACF